MVTIAAVLAHGRSHVALGDETALAARPLPGAPVFRDGVCLELRLSIGTKDAERLRRSPREFVRATVLEGTTTYHNVGVHLKGRVGSFQPLDQKPSFTLDFEKFSPAQRFHGLRRVHLNNSVEDASYLNEQLGSEVFRAAGVPAPRVSHARVTFNGRGLGLFVLKEGFTEDFLGRYFQRTGGNLYDTDWGHDVDTRMKGQLGAADSKEQTDLDALAQAAKEADQGRRWDRLGSTLDLDRFLSFMATEVMLGHRDGYCLARNNFRVYHDLNSGRLVFLPQGMDQLLGRADLPWNPHMAGLVARAVLDTPIGQARYRQRFVQLFHERFDPGVLSRRVDSLWSALEQSLTARELREVAPEVELVKQRIRQRAANLEGQLSQPEPKLARFKDGLARPTGWLPVDRASSRRMDEAAAPDGRPALHIIADNSTSASWRATVLLGPGHYRFEGNARVNRVEPLPFGNTHGAGLRVTGAARAGHGLVGDTTWSPLDTTFEVKGPPHAVELVCELRASAGEAWFDAQSLRLARMP